MAKSKASKQQSRPSKRLLIGLVILLALVALGLVAAWAISSVRQSRLNPFYDTAGLQPKGRPGQIIRQESLGVKVDDGKAYRVLYRTQRADGSYTFTSGMIFVPYNANAGLPRPVVAWAHGTLGLGDQCAPSRTADPVRSISWVDTMLKKGWVVTATDYAGFGTPGTQGYLVGGDEAHDVLNSVRAARDLAQAHAGRDFIIWGHSQGGNSALFATRASSAYSPELKLEGTVASAPAAELLPLLNEQYGTVADWVIGPLIVTSWPAANPGLNADSVMTTAGRDNYKRIADHCIVRSTLGGLVRSVLGQKFFSANPATLPAWKSMASRQSAPLPAPDFPLLVVESKVDKVVLPDTTALYIQQSCRADPAVSTLWLDKVAHQDIPGKSADDVINWIDGRFAGQANASSCGQPLPVQPAKP